MNRMQNIQFMSFSCYFYFSSFFGVASNDAHVGVRLPAIRAAA